MWVICRRSRKQMRFKTERWWRRWEMLWIKGKKLTRGWAEQGKSHWIASRKPSYTMCLFPPKLQKQQRKWKKESEVAQACLTLCDPVDCTPPGSSVHGILQAWILEWVAISFSRGSSWPGDRIQVSHIAGRRFNLCTTREARRSSIESAKTRLWADCGSDHELLMPNSDLNWKK